MKKVFKNSLFVLSLFALLAPSITSCSSSSEYYTYVYVLNAEDYIDDSLITSFEDEVFERDNKKVKIVYETYDTNETMYNTLKTGKQTYDVICCSDYMIQRLAREGLVDSFQQAFDDGLLDNYRNNVSPYLATYDGEDSGKLNQIEVKTLDGTDKLSNYAIGYMWGTLGILYNPELIYSRNYNVFSSDERTKDLSEEDSISYIIENFNSLDGWSALWDPLYKGTQSIKDSMRDTYAVGIMELYKDYFLPTSGKYLSNYNDRNDKFNSCDNDTIKGVQDELIRLKGNIFGFEVDSGKDDIVTKKIGVNIAWSGDAVNSIGRGYYADDDWEEVRDESDMVNLYYTIPKLGANVWFDAWCAPKQDEGYYESDEYRYAMEFLDYLNDPTNACANMSYNGYTSFIGSNSEDDLSVLAYTLYCYDLREEGDEPLDDYDTYDLSYYFNFVDENGQPLTELTITAYDPLADTEEEGLEADGREFTFTDEDGDGRLDIILATDLTSYEGRSLVAQYPKTQDINNLYVMRDFKDKNDAIVSMWENVKVNPLPAWVVATLLVFLIGGLSYLGSYPLIRKYKLKKRKELRKAN